MLKKSEISWCMARCQYATMTSVTRNTSHVHSHHHISIITGNILVKTVDDSKVGVAFIYKSPGPDPSPSDMVFIICRKHISRLRVSAWSSLSKREPNPIRDCGLANCINHINIVLGMCYCTAIKLRIIQQPMCLLTFSHPSIFSLLRSLLLGLDSILMSEPRESVLFAVDTASDENTKRKNKSLNGCLPA